MKFTLNLNKKEFNMKKAKMLSLTAGLVLAITFTLSCSSPDDGGGGDPQSYNYCIYNEAQMCVAGPYKDCPGGGIPGNSCPYGDDPSSSSLPAPSSSSYSSSIPSSSYYTSLYGISDVATCQYLDAMLLGGGSMTEDDWEGKGYSFADVKGAWDQYRLSGTGVMLSSQGGYTEDVLRAKITQGGLTPSELNAYMRGLNQRGNQLTILLPSEIVAFYNSNNSSCYAVLYVEKE